MRSKWLWLGPLVLAVAAMAALFLFPLVRENAATQCGAFEQAELRSVTDAAGQLRLGAFTISAGSVARMERQSRGRIAAALFAAKHQDVPAAWDCMAGYYRLLWDGHPLR